jgi:UDP-N-acetylglucosamine--N-acetylmuramyl-(pentapeptide) pyrophosphoryl-undecaprenol N-acetylglucosamine transferase
MKRIVLVGGGSGGHFYPLIAVAEKLRADQNIALYYMGPDVYDKDTLQGLGITFVYVPAGKKRKYRSLLNFFDIWKTLFGVVISVFKLFVIYPDVVFSKGGYTSVPVTLAAYMLRIPVVIHESDTKVGSANKLAARFARYIAISFPDMRAAFTTSNVAHTGVPLRSIFTKDIQNPHALLGVATTKPIILVTGGSQGAQRLNDLVLESLDELLPAFSVIHQTGQIHEQNVQATAASLISEHALLDSYFVKGTLSAAEMSAAMSACALVISRAGTGTIFEIAHKGKPAILIPIPESISHDQKTNAYTYARSGAATVLEEHNLTDGLLASEIMRMIGDQTLYESMAAAAKNFAQGDAAQTIADALVSISNEHA